MFRWLMVTMLFAALLLPVCSFADTRAPGPDTMQAQVQQAVDALLTTKDWLQLYRLVNETWPKTLPEAVQKQLIVALLKRMPSDRALVLENTCDMVIMSRLAAGKMSFAGHGIILQQDLYLEGGRCAWAIEELIGSTGLPAITEGMTPAQREEAARQAAYRVIEVMAMPTKAR